jgi:GNAT superfamily N-acetyltransferase
MRLTQIRRDDRRGVRAFLNLPFRIYADIPQWVPPLRPGERARFSPDYAFYRYSEAAFFLVWDGDQAVGRIAVLEHRPHNAYRHHRDALLYLYEAVDDDEVARLLFDAAAEWAAGRGLDRLLGPKGFLTGEGHGLLIEGFEHRPAIGVPYNPPYYVRHWEDIGGMTKVLDYVSARTDRETVTYPERIRRIADRVRERRNFHVPTFHTKRELRAQADAIQRAYNRAFATVWAYTPIPDEELEAVVDRLMLIADPPLMKLIFKGDTLVGFQFAYPDISAAIQRTKGRIWPFGWIALLLEKRRTNWLNVNGNAILPAYQGSGANAVLYDEMLKTLLEARYRYADLVQVQEDNAAMLADLKALVPFEIYKRHRVYERRL